MTSKREQTGFQTVKGLTRVFSWFLVTVLDLQWSSFSIFNFPLLYSARMICNIFHMTVYTMLPSIWSLMHFVWLPWTSDKGTVNISHLYILYGRFSRVFHIQNVASTQECCSSLYWIHIRPSGTHQCCMVKSDSVLQISRLSERFLWSNHMLSRVEK
jgi:hypothetical protein